jgi:ESX-1 secreted protein B PE domain
MTSGEVRVDTGDLTAKAGQIEGLTWPDKSAQAPLAPPDALPESGTAILNLTSNAEGLWNSQEYGRLEGLRLAETLRLVAGAYNQVDTNAMEDINNGGQGSSPPTVPGVNQLPKPPRPLSIPVPKGQLVDDGLLVPATQARLHAGDQAASLRAAAEMWRKNAASLATAAEGFEVSTVNWEGEAADAAYRQFND